MQAAQRRQLARWRENWTALHAADTNTSPDTPDGLPTVATGLAIEVAGEALGLWGLVVGLGIAGGATLLDKVTGWWSRRRAGRRRTAWQREDHDRPA